MAGAAGIAVVVAAAEATTVAEAGAVITDNGFVGLLVV
jgi:hypothetical protein